MKIYISSDNDNLFYRIGDNVKAVPITYDEAIDLVKDSCDVMENELDSWNIEDYDKIKDLLK